MQQKTKSYTRASFSKKLGQKPTLSSSLKAFRSNKKLKTGKINTTNTKSMTAAVAQPSASLADSISVSSSTATPRTMNTTKLSSRSTALTIRNSNVTPKGKDKTTASSTTKRARTDNSTDSPSTDIVPIERRPLPSARQLSKVLCRIVDDEAYTERDAEIALETLHHWALKQNVAFGNHFADVGGLQQVLFFVEDHIYDCKCIMPAFWLMETLCRPLQGASATIYESKALSNMRSKIGKCIVDVGGVHLMLRTFQFHALPSKAVTPSNNTSATNDEIQKAKASSAAVTDSNKENNGEFAMWKSFKTLVKASTGISEEMIMNPCTIDQLMCGSPDVNMHIADMDDDVNVLAIDTARHSMDVLALLIPHVVGIDKTAPGKIIQTLCDAIPILLSEMKAKSASVTKENPDEKTPNKVEKVYEALIASVLKCLVATTAVASKDTFTSGQSAKAKLVVSVTNMIMKTFPSHQGMNRDGCIVLQRVCRHLPKSDRKRLGVVASLGAVVASASIDQEVKDIADEILEEQFK